MGRDKKGESLPDLPDFEVKPIKPAWYPPNVISEFGGWANPSPYITVAADGSLTRAVSGIEQPHRLPWAFPHPMRTQDRVPAIGQYDEQDPAVERWRLEYLRGTPNVVLCKQIGWSLEHSIPAKMREWATPIASPLLYRWIVDNHVAVPDSGVQLCLSNWDVGFTDPAYVKMLIDECKWTVADLKDSMALYAQTCAGFMTEPEYWRINDKPVLYRGWAHTLPWYQEHPKFKDAEEQKRYSFDLSAKQILQIWRDEIKRVVGVEPYLVATSMDPASHKYLKGWGFDCLTQYGLHGKGWANTMDTYRWHWVRDLATCRAQGLGYIVPVTSGYNAETWDTQEYRDGYTYVPTPAELTAHVRAGIQLARDNQDVCIAVGAYSLTEHGEQSTPLEPKAPEFGGDAMLRAYKAALT